MIRVITVRCLYTGSYKSKRLGDAIIKMEEDGWEFITATQDDLEYTLFFKKA